MSNAKLITILSLISTALALPHNVTMVPRKDMGGKDYKGPTGMTVWEPNHSVTAQHWVDVQNDPGQYYRNAWKGALYGDKDACKLQFSIQLWTDWQLFTASLEEFEHNRDSWNPPTVDWSSDGCTSSPDAPSGFEFLPACHRHDFGYQNLEHQERFTEGLRKVIDENFKEDLLHICDGNHLCNTWSSCFDL